MPKQVKQRTATPEAQARWRDYGRLGGARMARINIAALKNHRQADAIDQDEINSVLFTLDAIMTRLNARMKPDAQD